MTEKVKIPIIIDTDIGSDIDDTWALGLLLLSPEVDIKLIVTAMDDTAARARLTCKILEKTGRTDIPVGIGIKTSDTIPKQTFWASNYSLSDYPGKIYEDGVGAIINTVNSGNEVMTIVALAPVPNLAEAIRLCPEFVKKTKLVGMQGSIRVGYYGTSDISAENNVECDIASWRSTFTAPWQSISITPLDTCGDIVLDKERLDKIKASDCAIAKAVIQNSLFWADINHNGHYIEKTSVLYDTVAAYMAFRNDNLIFENLPVWCDDGGFTRICPEKVMSGEACEMSVATKWVDKNKFYDFLIGRFCG